MTTQPHSESWSRRRFLGGMGGFSLAALAAGEDAWAREGADGGKAPALENEALRVSLSLLDASITVVDKRIGLVWRQAPRPGFRVAADTVRVGPTTLSATVTGEDATYAVSISFAQECPHAFDLALDAPDRRYIEFPGYPFPFAAPGGGWDYVQNTTGEGMLMPLEKA
ncbi:MAG: hypothetical protein NTW86_26210, partial [Candidatus Sumerlaeota bacterium]|nr:hypothetical protein [Candidatus Sumerlaeota bacterium]